MNADIPPRSQDSGPGTSAGPYDVVIFALRSLGILLPTVLIVALIAYGTWYAIREVNSLQTQIIVVVGQKAEAEIKKAQAEADAKAAANIAKYDALQEVSKQLIELNGISANVSKRIQDLVSAQIDNMKKSEELAKLQSERSKEYQSQLEQASQAELSKLQTQIVEATKLANEQAITAAIAAYNDIKNTIALGLKRGYPFVDNQVLELLEQKLSNPIAEKQAISDITDSKNDWRLRFIIALRLFRRTSDEEYIRHARSLVEKNKQSDQAAIASVLTRYDAFPPEQPSVVSAMLIDFITDEEFTKQFRLDLLTSSVIRWSDNLIVGMGPDKVKRFAQYAGSVLVETALTKTAYCFQITSLLGALNQLSQDAALVYTHHALKNPGGTESEAECIKTELDKAVGQREPTPEMIQQWPVKGR